MFSISGLRGIIDKDLSPELIYGYAAAFGEYIGRGKVVIGRDSRKSGLAYSKAVTKGLNSVGCHVIDLGIVPTPTVLYIVKKNRAKGGIVVTASHNPIEWNALKFISSRGRFLSAKEFLFFSKKVKDIGQNPILTQSTAGNDELTNAVQKHIDRIVSIFKPISQRLSIGVDAVNGAGSIALPKLLEVLGCGVSRLYCRFSSKFPRPPEPRSQNLTALSEFVKRKRLDLGIACDPDCDRLSVVDENGKPVGEEKTIVLAADYLLKRKKGSIVTNLSTTALIDDIAKKHDCRLYRTKVGEANVVSKMIEVDALIGGEGNGGIIYPTINFTRDALVATAIIIKFIAEEKKTLSQIITRYPKYYMKKTKVMISKEKFESKKEKLKYIMKGRVSFLDGIRITTKDAWFHVRPSQTEPFVRIIGEAKKKKKLSEHIKEIKDILS